MKKLLRASVAITILSLSFLAANGQKLTYKLSAEKYKKLAQYASTEDAGIEPKNDYSYLYKINIKAVRDFMKTYPDITNQKWEILEGGYLASFVLNSVWIKNFYDKKGIWQYSIKEYNETKLPKDVRAIVKSTYYDYLITVVREVNMHKNNSEPTYLVHIKYDTTYKIIKVFNGEMEEAHL